MDLCSKCFRETHAQKKVQDAPPPSPETAPQQQAAAAAVDDIPAGVDAAPAAIAPIEETTAPTAPILIPTTTATTSTTAAAAAPPADAGEPEKPVQAHRNRCFCCNKKVGLLGFECRCGYVYCSGHRHAADHTCAFDYGSFDRERLTKMNPVIAASKIDKL